MTAKKDKKSLLLEVRTLLLVAFLLALIAGIFIFNSHKAGAVLSTRSVEPLADVSHMADPALPETSQLMANLAAFPFLEAPSYPEAIQVASWAPTRGNLEAELTCLSLNIYHEARGEPGSGQTAVAHVVMNRVADRRFPSSVCEVVRQGGELTKHGCQFSWWCDGRSDRPRNGRSWQETEEIARSVYWGLSKDPTKGALWYHADYVSPYWSRVFTKGPKIGSHIFYHDGRKLRLQVASSS